MSHFVESEAVEIADLKSWVIAMQKLGFKGKVSYNTTIEDWGHRKENVEAAIQVDSRYAIGLKKKSNGRYAMLGDYQMMSGIPSALRNLNDKDLQNKILQETTLESVVSRYAAEGFDADVQRQSNGDVKVKLTRMAGGSRF